MKKITSLLILLCAGTIISSAQVTWSDDIAPILYANCTTCHHDGGIAPFSLIPYYQAYNNAISIKTYVDAKLMPPWLADPDCAHFKEEKILEQSEIDLISQWVADGALAGDSNAGPPIPVYNGALLLNNVDDTIILPHYTVTAAVDDYRSFVLHSNYPDTTYINQLQFIPGAPSAVHHCFIFEDATPDSWNIQAAEDAVDPTPGYYATGMGGFSLNAQVFTGYIPGTDPIKFPPNWGYVIPNNADYCFSFHYGPGSQGQTDSTKMFVKFCNVPDSILRPVYNQRLLWWYDSSLLNPPFIIFKNTVDTFWEESPDFYKPMSIAAIQPHMHLIGKSIRAWMIRPNGDSVCLINIPKWDWNWQANYFVTKLIKIDSGAKIYDEGIYDNTVNNPNNPNDPPQNIHSGEGTEDEMMAIRFSLLDYMPGDEDYILDSAFYGLPTSTTITEYDMGVKVFPNPAHDQLWFNAWLSENEVDWQFTDISGRVMQEKHERNTMKGSYTQQIDISNLSTGIYFFTIKSGEERAIRKVVIEK